MHMTTHLAIIDCDALVCPPPVPHLEYGGLNIVEGDVAYCELLIPDVHSVFS